MNRLLVAALALAGCVSETRAALIEDSGAPDSEVTEPDAGADAEHHDTVDGGVDAMADDARAGTGGSGGSGSGSGGSGGSGATGGSGGFSGSGGSGGSAGTSCTMVAFYRDEDEDGFGDAADSVQACALSGGYVLPVGYVENADDCYDLNAEANPDAAADRNARDYDRGDGSYDFDCDGVETLRWTAMSPCLGLTGGGGDEGWRDACVESTPDGCTLFQGPPGCGVRHYWVLETGACPAQGQYRTQRCR